MNDILVIRSHRKGPPFVSEELEATIIMLLEISSTDMYKFFLIFFHVDRAEQNLLWIASWWERCHMTDTIFSDLNYEESTSKRPYKPAMIFIT